MNRRHWTPQEIEYLRRYYPDTATQVLVQRLNRSEKAIYQMAKTLGVCKTEDYKRRNVYNLDPNTGAQYRFKSGHTTWNKGKSFQAGGNSIRTQFKPGQVPHNAYKTDYVVTKRRDGYLWIRVALGEWMLYHRWLYQKVMCVTLTTDDLIKFRNGNPMDVRIENLYRTDKQGNMLENSVHNYPPEVVSLVQTIGVLKRTINARSKQQPGQGADQ